MAQFSGWQPYLNLALVGGGIGALIGWGNSLFAGALLGAVLGIGLALGAPWAAAAVVSRVASKRNNRHEDT